MTVYRGSYGQWAWIAHRVAGAAIFLFLLVHIADTALIGWGPNLYNKFVAFYRHPVFRIGEAFLAAAVLFHALNGVRIMTIDFWEGGSAAQKKLLYVVATLFLAILLPGLYVMLTPLLKGG